MRWPIVTWVCLWALFSIPWTSTSPTPHWDRVRPPRVRATSRVKPDHVRNVLFYIPLAPLGAASGWSLPATVALGTGLSITAETLQLYSSERSPDGNDVVANVGGTVIGAMLVLAGRRRSRAGTSHSRTS